MASKFIISTSTVTLHFAIELTDGSVVESTWQRKKPVQFTMGDGNFPASFEKKLLGLKASEKAKFDMTAKEGFGAYNKDNIKQIPLKQFPDNIKPEVGLIVTFAHPNGQEAIGAITEVMTNVAKVDFNHPLADKELVFKVEIITVD